MAGANSSFVQRVSNATSSIVSFIFSEPLRQAWFTILIAAALVFGFVVPGLISEQFREALIDYAPAPDHPWVNFNWITAGLTTGAIWILSAALRYWTARLLHFDIRSAGLASVPIGKRLLLGVIWLSPWFALSGAYLQVNGELPGARLLAWTPYSLLSACCLVAPIIALIIWSLPAAQGAIARINANKTLWFISNCMLPASFLVAVGLFGTPDRHSVWGLPFDSIFLAQWIGPMALFAFSLAAMTAAGSQMILAGRNWRLPLFWITAIWVVAMSTFALNDNHPIRVIQRQPTALPALDGAMQSWTALHPGNGPIILVSAEGGGIRAAYMTAITLARIADRCPAAANRVFAISGVSGGSIGAAVYAAAMHARPLDPGDTRCDMRPASPGWYEQRIDRVFRRDHLSPVLARFLFPDALQRLLWFPVNAFDRQLGLEYSLENAFAREFDNSTALSAPFYTLAPSASSPSTPYLVFGTTAVASGNRVYATQVAPPQDPALAYVNVQDATAGARTFYDVNPALDLPLISAAAASARFPYVSPSGRINTRTGSERFVDGGYFDNSGDVPLTEIYRRLAPNEHARPIIIMHVGAQSERPPPPLGLDEFLNPIETVLNARTARVQFTRARLMQETDTIMRQRDVSGVEYLTIQICASRERCRNPDSEMTDTPVPLGWFLSSRAANEMRRQLGLRSAGECHENQCQLEALGAHFAVN